MTVPIVATALTHDGLQRGHNEDAIAVADWVASEPMEEPAERRLLPKEPVVALVADGMGGHAAGEVASRLVAESLSAQAALATDAAAVAGLIRAAHADLYERMAEQPRLSGMGTTVAGIAITPTRVVVFNVGDSRVYRIDGRRPVQLSTDDTPGPKLDDGRTAAFTTPIVTQALGGGFALDELEPHVLEEPLVLGRRYLICTDGLTDILSHEELLGLIEDDDRATVEALFAAAMARGAPDNVSVLILRLVASSSGPGGEHHDMPSADRVEAELGTDPQAS